MRKLTRCRKSRRKSRLSSSVEEARATRSPSNRDLGAPAECSVLLQDERVVFQAGVLEVPKATLVPWEREQSVVFRWERLVVEERLLMVRGRFRKCL